MPNLFCPLATENTSPLSRCFQASSLGMERRCVTFPTSRALVWPMCWTLLRTMFGSIRPSTQAMVFSIMVSMWMICHTATFLGEVLSRYSNCSMIFHHANIQIFYEDHWVHPFLCSRRRPCGGELLHGSLKIRQLRPGILDDETGYESWHSNGNCKTKQSHQTQWGVSSAIAVCRKSSKVQIERLSEEYTRFISKKK